jgi:hypothetical protein
MDDRKIVARRQSMEEMLRSRFDLWYHVGVGLIRCCVSTGAKNRTTGCNGTLENRFGQSLFNASCCVSGTNRR